jgi:hypothetical protein
MEKVQNEGTALDGRWARVQNPSAQADRPHGPPANQEKELDMNACQQIISLTSCKTLVETNAWLGPKRASGGQAMGSALTIGRAEAPLNCS